MLFLGIVAIVTVLSRGTERLMAPERNLCESRLCALRCPATMMLHRLRQLLTHCAPLFLVALSVIGLLLSGGSLPHVHGPDHPGLHNQEHDLSYLATFGNAGPVPDATAVAPFGLVAPRGVIQLVSQPAAAPKRHADFRAPPAR
jgi:hypothetical protein